MKQTYEKPVLKDEGAIKALTAGISEA